MESDAHHYTLDGNGNRISTTKEEPLTYSMGTSSTAYTYNTQRNRLLTTGTTAFTYDDEGQLRTKGGTSYTFDYEHRLTGIGSSYAYAYDGMGKRLKAVRNGTETRYIYDAAGNLLAEADSTNTITRYYIYGQGLLAMVTASDQIYSYHFNAIGSTMALTDSTQGLVKKYAYTPFGTLANQQGSIDQPFTYVGQFGVMTELNGLYYMRARYYDPEVGRFISEDPAGFGGGDVSLYVYAGNNPVLLIDPLGLCNRYSGFAIDFGGSYGSGWGDKSNSTGGAAGSGIFVGVRPNSGGHAQIGGFVYQSDPDEVPGAKLGLGVNLTLYKGDSRDLFSGTTNYTSMTFTIVTLTKYTNQSNGKTTGSSKPLRGRFIPINFPSLPVPRLFSV